ncbi:protein tamozhennic isoform X2 [Condylostylus longicornis]|uniref:protein tamozhennic isoform X2 n=1 Tax=Condylostylus longicornis TaxID=2530218 RepID=UPI00244E3F1A|nr:protein tamozhennic isoform X2 [Condylostylus longicornis]
MSDFVSQNMLPDLWEDILQRHWTYLETEESMLKLDERKKLEGCLKQFLCIVPHDRKFFLPETSYVLKKSIEEMPDFSAYNAMVGFESISQYANNLFTKPWRKEYKVIKMYSGFYQHEIKSKLLYAEKLFEAMGYRQFNQLLVLDGPICPDQVTNVSRDAMAAYVECQIMKQILSGLTSMQLSCNWLDIFKFRETHISGQSQAIKMMAHVLQEKRFRKEKLNQDSCYASKHQHMLQQQQNCYANCNSALCHFQQQSNTSHQIPMQPINPCQLHNTSQQQPPTVVHKFPQHSCTLHNKHIQPSQSSIYNNSQLNYPNYPHMSHSKSLEHYNDSVTSSIMPQRHSFDHYEPTFDCVDAGCNFNVYNHHPYNVSGNRYPLPYNISNQIMYGQGYHHQQPIPTPVPSSHSSLGNFNQNGHHNKIDASSIYGYQQHPSQQCTVANGSNRPIKTLSHESSCNAHAHDEYTPSQNHRRSITTANSLQNDQLIQLTNQVKDSMYIDTDDNDGNYIYSKPRHTQSNLAKKVPVDIQKLHTDNIEAAKLVKQNSSSASVSSKSSKSANNKNQDGVGSFESWNFVFQNLEKHGYSKDLGERGLDSKTNDGNNIAGHSPYDDETHATPHQNSSKKNRESLTSNIMTTQNSKHKDKQDLKNNHSNATVLNNRESSSIRKSHKTKVMKNSVNNNVENYVENLNSSSNSCKVTLGEWSCRFCTFLNPDSKRICEMCARSKDFNLDATKSSTATCV